MFYKALLNYDKEDIFIKKFHKSYKELLDKKIKSDYDFILFVLNYYIESVGFNILPNTTKITKIDGDLNGFILSSNQNITVVIEDNMKNYVLTFTNNYDNKILNSIKVEK